MHTCTTYDSIQDVPPDVWGCLVTEVDFAMDRRLVTLQQRTLREQSRMWVMVVRDGAIEPAAIACLARFDLEIVNLHGWLRIAVGAAREVWRRFLKNRVLFVGLPLPWRRIICGLLRGQTKKWRWKRSIGGCRN